MERKLGRWHMPVIPVFKRQRQENSQCILDQPDPHSEFQGIWGNIGKPCPKSLGKRKKKDVSD